MEKIGNLNKIFSLSNDGARKFIIVGMGMDGEWICRKITDVGYIVKYFVDENIKRIKKTFLNVPVKLPEECEIDAKDIVIVCIGRFLRMAESDVLKKSIIKNLPLKGNTIYLWDKYQYSQDAVLNVFHKNNIDTDAKFLKIGNLMLPNYLLMDKSVNRSFTMEARDLILPYYFNEWSAINEGPYRTPPGGGGNF